MSSEERAPDARRFVRTTRLEAFSDGVFAIAITLLVLDLAIPADGSPWERVAKGWPFYLAYVVSFLTIGAAWLGHTAITDRLDKADLVLLRINLLLLLSSPCCRFPRAWSPRASTTSKASASSSRCMGSCCWASGCSCLPSMRTLGESASTQTASTSPPPGGEASWPSWSATAPPSSSASYFLQSRSACTAPSPLFSSYLSPKRNASSHVARSRRTALALTAPPWSWRYRTADGGGIGRVGPDGGVDLGVTRSLTRVSDHG